MSELITLTSSFEQEVMLETRSTLLSTYIDARQEDVQALARHNHPLPLSKDAHLTGMHRNPLAYPNATRTWVYRVPGAPTLCTPIPLQMGRHN